MTLMHSPVFDDWMAEALHEAEAALAHADVPVGALVIDAEGNVVARAHNEREAEHDPTAHAEILALRRASQVWGSWQLPNTTLVVTLEPCIMCAGAILAARVPRVIFGAWDAKAGAAGSVYDVLRDRRFNHQVEVVPDINAEPSEQLLKQYFQAKRS